MTIYPNPSLLYYVVNLNCLRIRARFLVQVTIYRRLRIVRDDHLDQSEAYDISKLGRE